MATSNDPDRTAVVSGDVRLTTQQLSDLADGGAGIIAGSEASHVAYVGTGGAMLPLLIFASARAGVAFTPINYRLSADGIRTLIARLPDPLVVVDRRYLDELGGALGPNGLKGLAKQVIVSDEFLAQAADAEPAAVFADPESVGIVLFTSGTTSQPRPWSSRTTT
jgi:long-chain acyl-CoA synthetase